MMMSIKHILSIVSYFLFRGFGFKNDLFHFSESVKFIRSNEC